MKTTRRTFIKLVGATLASLWAVDRKSIDVEAECTGEKVLEAKASVEPNPDVATKWDTSCYFIASKADIWPVNCAMCDRYFCNDDCPHREQRLDEMATGHDPRTKMKTYCQGDCSKCAVDIIGCPKELGWFDESANAGWAKNPDEVWYTEEDPQSWPPGAECESFGDVLSVKIPDPDKPGQFIIVGQVKEREQEWIRPDCRFQPCDETCPLFENRGKDCYETQSDFEDVQGCWVFGDCTLECDSCNLRTENRIAFCTHATKEGDAVEVFLKDPVDVEIRPTDCHSKRHPSN